MLVTLTVPPRQPVARTGPVTVASLPNRRSILILGGAMFLGFGLFVALLTWLDPLESKAGHGALGHTLLTVITLGGIGGAAILPTVAQRTERRREIGALIFIVSGLCLTGLALAGMRSVLITFAVVLGFFLMAGLPLIYDWSEVIVGPEFAGTAIGFLTLLANLGGVALTFLVQATLARPAVSLLLLAAACVVGLELTLRMARAERPHLSAPERASAPSPQPQPRIPEKRAGERRTRRWLLVASILAWTILVGRRAPGSRWA